MSSIGRIRYADLVDIPKLQALMESFSEVVGIANAVIDVDGGVIVQAGWQEACTGFHRVNSETCRRCVESDTSLAASMTAGKPFAVYRCRNGLVDTAAPIIVQGEHLANVFTGQFLTEAPDPAFFKSQARQFGFDEADYLAAISRVPVLPRERIESVTRLYAQLAAMLADNGLDRLRQMQAGAALERLNTVLEEKVAARTQALAAANEQLAGRKAVLKQVLDTSSVAIFLVDKQGRITQANQRMAEMFGRSVDALVGDEYVALVHPDERDSGRRKMLDLLDSAIPAVDLERLYWRADQTEFWGHLTGRRFYDAHGEQQGLVGVIADVTERRQAEEALRLKARYQRALLDNFPFAVWLKDTQGRFLSVNKAFAQVSGAASADELVGKSDFDTVAHDQAGRNRADDRAVLASRQSKHVEEEVQTGSGRQWFETYKTPVIDDDGQLLGTVGFTRDITERRKMEESIQETQEKYRGLSEAAFEAVFISENGLCLEQNRRAQHMFGYSDEEALGRLGTQWIVPEDRERVMHHMMTGYELPYEVTGLRKDGSTFAAIIRGKMMHYKGRTVRVTAMSDITERKQAEEALRRSETKFRTLYDATDDAVMMLDASGFLGCNKATLGLFGCTTQEEFCACHPADLSPPKQACGNDSRLLSNRHIALAMENGSHRFEWIHRRHDTGETFAAEVLLSAMLLDGQCVLQCTVRNISLRKAAEEKIKTLAFYDPLTRLPNRRLLLDRLEQAMTASARHQRQGALLFIDLDNFKALNDRLGHGIGDLMLEQVALRLATCIREVDTVARLGGDEFVVMLEDLSDNAQEAALQARAVGEKILATLSESYQLASYTHHSSASIGITLFCDHEETLDEPMRRADLAMYQAKAAGRNTLRFFDPATPLQTSPP